jgi:hypothetical protein
VAQVSDLSRNLTAFDRRRSWYGLAAGKTIGQHHHAMRLSVPFPNQQSARCQGRSLSVQALQPVRHRRTRLVRTGVIQNLSELMIEIAMTISLDSKSQDRKQQMPGKERRSQENAMPLGGAEGERLSPTQPFKPRATLMPQQFQAPTFSGGCFRGAGSEQNIYRCDLSHVRLRCQGLICPP